MPTRQTIPEQSAVFHGTIEVPTASPGQRVGEVRKRLAGGSFETADAVVVIDLEVAIGLITLETLFACSDEQPVEQVMIPDPPTVEEDVDQEIAAHLMVDSGAGCLVVAGADGKFRGVISPERMLSVLLEEHEEDLARIGGYTAGSARSIRAAEEPVGQRLWHRLPWLMVGLLGAMVSALIMGAFDEKLESNVLIALFVPAIVYMAGAVGSQTQTVLIRAFAVGVTTRKILVRELLTGVLMGVVIAVVFLAFSLVVWGDAEVALAVAVALFASATVAVAVALALPSLFQRLGLDPAFGSGPLATLIQDLLSISTYFAAVLLIVS